MMEAPSARRFGTGRLAVARQPPPWFPLKGSFSLLFWQPEAVLPKFPLPTHEVVLQGVVPNAFSQCVVAYDETEARCLRKALLLADAISDLLEVGHHQPTDVMEYRVGPKTEFQRYIRLSRKDMKDYNIGHVASDEGKLFDHQPLKLNDDDYERVQQIPVKKGANFRDLKGVRVGVNNTVEWVPNMPRVLLSSEKPLAPDYGMSLSRESQQNLLGAYGGMKLFPLLSPELNLTTRLFCIPARTVLSIRENARLQGFPDYYRLLGPIKQKYIQVGNAVAVPVARALGCSLGLAFRGEFDGDQPLFKLPESFHSIDQATVTRSSVGIPGGEVVESE